MSIGMPPSASTSIFGSSRLAMAEAKLVVRYWARPPLSISSSFGGIGGGGRSFRYLVDTTMSCLKPAFGSMEAAMMQKLEVNWYQESEWTLQPGYRDSSGQLCIGIVERSGTVEGRNTNC